MRPGLQLGKGPLLARSPEALWSVGDSGTEGEPDDSLLASVLCFFGGRI